MLGQYSSAIATAQTKLEEHPTAFFLGGTAVAGFMLWSYYNKPAPSPLSSFQNMIREEFKKGELLTKVFESVFADLSLELKEEVLQEQPFLNQEGELFEEMVNAGTQSKLIQFLPEIISLLLSDETKKILEEICKEPQENLKFFLLNLCRKAKISKDLALISTKSLTSFGKNNQWAKHNAYWLKEEGRIILQKIYEPQTQFTNEHEIGNIIDKDQKLFKRTAFMAKIVRKDLHHQHNRNSLTKQLKNLNRMIRSNKNHANLRREYLLSLVALMWHFHDLAIVNGQALERGSYKIVDPDEKLFQFLRGYAQFATGQQNPAYLMGSNDFAYRRDPKWLLSSHYTAPNFLSTQYGIDMRLWGGHTTLDILPNQHSHLLFGQVTIDNVKHTIIKTEFIGLGHPLEYLEHASHFLLTETEMDTNDRREGKIPTELNKAFEDYLATNKELKKPSPYTISEMYKMIMANTSPTLKQQNVIRQFAHCLQKLNYEKDAIIRTGQEVILDFTYLSPSSRIKPNL